MRKFISGLVLGAGASQRLGEPKQLLPFRHTTLLGWVVEQTTKASGLDEVVVVLGRASDQIRERVDFGAVKVVDNPAFTEGCSSSYRAGITALDPQSDAIAIILGDQPGIEPSIIDQLTEHFRQSEKEIAICSYRGHRAHPMIFARSFFALLTELHGDKAAWKLIDANPDLLLEVFIDLPAPDDINTRDDFERLEFAGEEKP